VAALVSPALSVTKFGKGTGYIDTHLLAAARLTNGVQLWAADNKLHDVADELGVAFK